MEKTILCELCKKPVPVGDIKYVPKSKDSLMAVCSQCRQKRIAQRQPGPIAKIRRQAVEKKKYYCSLCKYVFRADPELQPVKCPYCGKPNHVAEQKTASAEELLREP